MHEINCLKVNVTNIPMLQNFQILYLTNFITSVDTRIVCCSMSDHLK